VLVSVADTRLRLDGRELEGTTLRTAFLLPRQQAGRLRVDGFCRERTADAASRLEIKDAFTARLSLRCGGDGWESVAYATLPLDVVLECRPVSPADDSDASPAQSSLRF
jgi:hypothetical protein